MPYSCGACDEFEVVEFCDPGPNRGQCKKLRKVGLISSTEIACSREFPQRLVYV
jgi:hypothetical protein